ncbi:lysozyme inhibitor LprI family protein [Sulfitobacter faviae]|uniref:Lysozyme inhibitor LprI family protein n=1 Tax=Sulfitobacter faviae TaxID=1775881 RepID=A0ABZ0V3G2_9RHOB|nr:lysozyme inhibitor LprI family protein [Sulfitobacter faviae]WPZ22410.1 lysozyme inhibitor LprI family protein [Sulfitobacter faviae]
MTKTIAFTLILAAAPMMVAAQDGPTFDCAKAESSAEKLICNDPDLAALDRRLAERFAAAVAVAEGLDVGAEETTKNLRAMQRGWISGRDECWKAPDLRPCVETQYLRREADLVAEFMLEPASDRIPLTCGPRAVTVNRFATPLPAVRVEEGDRVYPGALAEADTPGTYYLRGAGMLVMDHDEISIGDPYGEAQTCTVR